MKRDMDLVRKILLIAEQKEHGYINGNPAIQGYSDEVISYHIYLMDQAGLVEAMVSSTMGSKSPKTILRNITWLGHEFIDSARDETLWAKAKKTIISTTAGLTFDILFEWLKVEGQKRLGLA